MDENPPIREGQVLVGSLFIEPMRVETVRANGPVSWTAGLVGTQTERFRKVTLTPADLQKLTIVDSRFSFDGDGRLLRLGIQAYSLGIAYEFDPFFGLSISRVDPLPHQLEAVYDHLLKLARVRFLLADDAGAGKTIMAGLLLRELELRGLAERIMVVCPANLAFQWQRELKEKFGAQFLVLKGQDIREQFGVNQWLEQKRVITSLDLAKRADILPGLRQVHWDLVIVDEAHRMSAADETHKSLRYKLGELLRDTTDHLLLLTATPHKGDPLNFSLFLQLLDADAYADVKSIRQAMERRRAPFYLRRTKEAMVYFPERRPDGTWVAEKIFTKRIPHTVDFQIDNLEFDLYRDVTNFVKRQSSLAAAQGDDPRARAVGFLMSMYQRRLASSTYSMRHSLQNRAKRLEDGLKHAQELARLAPPDLPDAEEIEEMEDVERERLERMLEAVTLAGNAEQVREEIQELRALAVRAQAVEDSETEAKLSRLKNLMHEEGFFDHADKRLLVFTEFKDTLDYLMSRLQVWGFKVGCIHGNMKAGSRDEPGTRLHAEQQFKDGAIQVLVATEAAGEGINLQCCNILFNYDIPWNPNRLEQRMGRIHRYGQLKDCLIFNFVATNTIEGRVLQRLLEKLQEIRDALDDDAVFNVVGEVLPSAHVERVLRDYYAGKLGDADLEDRLLKDVDERQFRAICQNALEGLASKKLNLAMLVERRALAQERRVVPETIARFMREAAEYARLEVKPVPSLPHTFDPGRTPTALRQYEREPNWKLPALANRYPRCSTDRGTAETNKLEWVTPGHPLFEALRRHVSSLTVGAFGKGACFYSLQHEKPARVDFYRARVVDGMGNVIHERLFAVEITGAGEPALRESALMGDFMPCNVAQEVAQHVAQASSLHSDVDAVAQASSLHSDVDAVAQATSLHSDVDAVAQATSLHSDVDAVAQASSLHSDVDAVAQATSLHSDHSPSPLPAVAFLPGATAWLHEHAFQPFLDETRKDRLAEIERIAAHVELSLTELLTKADEEIGRAAAEVERKAGGAEGRLAQAEARHAELLARRDRRRQELERERSLSLQAVERLTSVLILPHPDRETPEVQRLRPNFETEAVAMQAVIAYEKAQGRQVYDVHEKNLGYDITSLDLNTGELRLIEVKGIGAVTGTILLTPNERRVAEDRRDCYWLYVVTNCNVAQASSLHGENVAGVDVAQAFSLHGENVADVDVAQASSLPLPSPSPTPSSLLSGSHHRGYLPHLKALGGTYFVTFRLADSLPKAVLDQLHAEFDAAATQENAPDAALNEAQARHRQELQSARIEEFLDAGTGACSLRMPEIGAMVLSALRHFDADRYTLHGAVVMPNHVHALLTPLGEHTLSSILHSWKSFTATQATRILGQVGVPFWQRESYDHLIRDEDDYANHLRYIAENPQKAGLANWPHVHVPQTSNEAQASHGAQAVAQASSLPYSENEHAGKMPALQNGEAGRMPALHAIKDPARFPWHEVSKVQHYWLEVSAVTKPMTVREDQRPYGGTRCR